MKLSIKDWAELLTERLPKISNNHPELDSLVAKDQKRVEELLATIMDDYHQWLEEESLELFYPDDEDESGVVAKTGEKNEPVTTLSDFFESYSGNWTPTYESGFGRLWETRHSHYWDMCFDVVSESLHDANPEMDDDERGEKAHNHTFEMIQWLNQLNPAEVEQEIPLSQWQIELLESLPGWKEFCEAND